MFYFERGLRMTNIKIVTDSSCIIAPEKMVGLDVHTINLSVMIDGVIYANPRDLDPHDFMNMMKASSTLPKTSQPPIGEFVELYDTLGADGSEIISIHLTEKLSGTVNTARQAANMSKSNVTVIDSDYIDQALGFQVYQAATMANAGASREEIVEAIERTKENTHLYIGVSTLDNLVKGGRVGKVMGALSGFLNMRVLLQLKGGELELRAKGRGNKTFTKWLATMTDSISQANITTIGISEADGRELSEELKKMLVTMKPDMSVPIFHTTPLVATHAGEGAFAIMYCTK